jgi:hypothetical protein
MGVVGVEGAHGIDEAGGIIVEIPIAIAIVVEGVRVIADDSVGAKVGIAVGGGACYVDNTDGIIAVAIAIVVSVVDVESVDSIDDASGVVKVAVAANDVAACSW